MDRADTPLCTKCTSGREENAKHYLLECTSYNNQRRILTEALRKLGINNLSMKNLLGGAEENEHKKKEITRLVGIYIKGTNRLGEL